MRIKPVFILAGVGVAFAAAALGNDALAKYEEPAYTVSLKDGNFEIRNYPSGIVASVDVIGSGTDAANRAFKILAGYIFGNNRSRTKIAMTVPVTQVPSSEKIAMTVPVTTEFNNSGMTMNFYMPAKYDLDSLPEPVDSRIKMFRLPARKFAVLKFSGLSSDANCKTHERRLRDWLRQNKIESSAIPLRAFYNPPWTLPFLRRNEIWIAL